jgi:hypothetical protein
VTGYRLDRFAKIEEMIAYFKPTVIGPGHPDQIDTAGKTPRRQRVRAARTSAVHHAGG